MRQRFAAINNRLSSLLQFSQQPQQAVENCPRMRRTTRNIKINGNDGVRAVVDLRMAEVGSTGNRAGADSDDDFRGRDRLISSRQSLFHVLGDRSGDEQAVGMTRGRDKLNAEPTQVKNNSVQHVDLCFTAVAAARRNLPELERSTEKSTGFIFQGVRPL